MSPEKENFKQAFCKGKNWPGRAGRQSLSENYSAAPRMQDYLFLGLVFFLIWKMACDVPESQWAAQPCVSVGASSLRFALATEGI